MRFASRLVRSVAITILLLGTTTLEGQQVAVSGRVVDGASKRSVGGAAVALSGVPGVVTDTAGHFRLDGVTPGTYALTASMAGYRLYTQRVSVPSSDLELTIELQHEVVALPRVVVRAHDVVVKGVVRDSATHRPLLQASVTLYPGSRTVGALTGRFSLDHVPAGEHVTLVVEAIEYLPEIIDIVANADTSIVASLGVDSVGRRMVAQQSKRLAQRSAAVPIAIDALSRDDLERTGELQFGVVLRQRLPYSLFKNKPLENVDLPCVFVDDRLTPFLQAVLQPIELLDRVEIYGRQASMIRVYSKRYVASLMREPTLPRITFLNSGLKTTCY